MKCPEATEKMAAYIDDELDPVGAKEMEAHLGRCAKCKAELYELRDADNLLKGLPRQTISMESATRLVRTIRSAGAIQDISRYSEKAPFGLLAWLQTLIEGLYDFLHPMKSPGTSTLDEFGDIPASFMGYAYFKIIDTRNGPQVKKLPARSG